MKFILNAYEQNRKFKLPHFFSMYVFIAVEDDCKDTNIYKSSAILYTNALIFILKLSVLHFN